MANSVVPDQMLHSAASDLGLHFLQRLIPIFRVITVASKILAYQMLHSAAADYASTQFAQIYPST